MNVVLIGGGTQLSYSIDIIEKQNLHTIVGILDSTKESGTYLFNYQVLGKQEEIIKLSEYYKIDGCIITIGDNWSRKIVFEQISKILPSIKWPNAIHPSVIIGSNVKLGKGILIMAGVIINSGANIGNFVNCFTRCNVEHDCQLEDFSSLSAGVVLGGKVRIGRYSAISLNATVFDRINIGENTVVGAGSLITKDLPDNVLVYGTPGKIIRNRVLGEKFLK